MPSSSSRRFHGLRAFQTLSSLILVLVVLGLASAADAALRRRCDSNDDCLGRRICYPPTDICQKPCQIACLVSDPVCGTDGRTYDCGQEDAFCHGAEVAHQGACDSSCAADEDCPVGQICTEGNCEGCVCPQVFDPVCGADGKTYGNACQAACAHVEVAHEGECSAECACNDECAEDTVCREGACQEPCDIRCFFPNPVCGSDGVTYWCGEKEASCHGASVLHRGLCRPSCESNADCRVGRVCSAPESCADPCGCASFCGPCDCPDDDAPVCGSDGRTYKNECRARCARVEVSQPGECPGFCGGIAGFPCPKGFACIDDPRDDCDPEQGGADCGGVCVPDWLTRFLNRLASLFP